MDLTKAFDTVSRGGQVVKRLLISKALGVDKISAKILKYSLATTLAILTRIFDSSFVSCTFPRAWKISEVTPILKSGDFSSNISVADPI